MSDERVENGTGAPSRRGLLVGAGAAGAVAVLAACGTDDANDPYSAVGGSDPSPAPSDSNSPEAVGESPAPEGEGDQAEQGDGGNGQPVAATSDVAVGGGVVLGDDDLVITQPTAGEWRGFSATCTHQGCTVSAVAEGTINCGCHGSQFSIEDGSVVSGPAGSPLPAKQVTADGESIYLA